MHLPMYEDYTDISLYVPVSSRYKYRDIDIHIDYILCLTGD